MFTIFGFYSLAMLLGGALGTSELVSRYKDSPLRAVLTFPALMYIGLNSVASVATLAVLREMQWLMDVGGGDIARLLIQSLAAGLSAMALLRTSLFTIRVGSTDVGIGPAAFLQIILSAADRACDRERATPRATAIQQIMTGISFQRAKQALPSLCFCLMQNVSGDEQRTFSTIVKGNCSPG